MSTLPGVDIPVEAEQVFFIVSNKNEEEKFRIPSELLFLLTTVNKNNKQIEQNSGGNKDQYSYNRVYYWKNMQKR